MSLFAFGSAAFLDLLCLKSGHYDWSLLYILTELRSICWAAEAECSLIRETLHVLVWASKASPSQWPGLFHEDINPAAGMTSLQLWLLPLSKHKDLLCQLASFSTILFEKSKLKFLSGLIITYFEDTNILMNSELIFRPLENMWQSNNSILLLLAFSIPLYIT